MAPVPQRGQHVKRRNARSARPKSLDVGQTPTLVQNEVTNSQGTVLGQQTDIESTLSSTGNGEANNRQRPRRRRLCYRMPKPTSGKEMYETERQIRQANAENTRLITLQQEQEQEQEREREQHQMTMRQRLQQHYGWDGEQQYQHPPLQASWNFNSFQLGQAGPSELRQEDQGQYQASTAFDSPYPFDQIPHMQQSPTFSYRMLWEESLESANQPLQPESTLFDPLDTTLMNAYSADPSSTPAPFAPELFVNDNSMLSTLSLQPEMHYDDEAIFPTTLCDNHDRMLCDLHLY